MNSNRCLLGIVLALFFATNVAVAQQELPLFPKYQVLGVIYAPPGSASTVSYTDSTQIGSSHSMMSDSSTTTTQTQTNTSGFNAFGLGYSTTTTTSDSWVSDYQNTNSESLQTTTGNGITVSGAISSALGIDHDNDLIAVWLNPVYKTTLMPLVTTNGVTTLPIQWSGFMFNSCDLNATQDPVNFVQLMNGCDPFSFPGPDIVYLPVFCLKNPYYPPTGCSQYLSHTSRFWDLNPWVVDSVTKVPLGPGLDIQDYADILQADPFVTQTLVANNTQSGENPYTNPCHPTYGINFDPNAAETIPDSTKFTAPYAGTWPAKYCGTPGTSMERFNFFSGSIPYPEPQTNGQPTTTPGSINSNVTNTEGMQATDTHTHSFNESTSLTFSAEVSYGPIAGVTISNLSAGFNLGTTSGSGTSWTDAQTIGHTATQSQTGSASYSITGPKLSDNWVGPITYNVYQDVVYGTFAFRDPDRATNTELISAGKTSPIGMAFSGSTNFGTVKVGNHSAAITVTLTNNSPNQLTLLSPALSFSDLAVDAANSTKLVSSFVIVSGSDGCSNKVLQAAATCTVKIEFAPTLNAAPNTQQASYPVAAYVIAAGNETVPVTDPGSTTYDELVLVTSTVITISGGKETAVTVSGTAEPAALSCATSSIAYPECNEGATLNAATPASGQPNGYAFAPYAGTAQVEKFVFTNYNSSPVVFPSYPGHIAFTDSADFSLAPNSGQTVDTCAGAQIAHGGTCDIFVQFVPTTTPSTLGLFGTRATAMGAISWPTGTTATIPLAFAGASGLPMGTIQISPKVSCTVSVQTGILTSCTTTQLSNNYHYPLTVTGVSSTPSGWFGLSNCTSVAANSSCTAQPTVTWSQQCSPTSGNPCTFSGTITLTGTVALPSGAQSVSTTVAATATATCTEPGHCPPAAVVLRSEESTKVVGAAGER